MVRGDDFFLRRWVAYYSMQLGAENLYVYFDGKDQIIPDYCKHCHTQLVDRVEGQVRQADRGRIDYLSSQAKILFERYDIVIGTDVDEFLVVDPRRGLSLREFLSNIKTRFSSVSALGVDVGQKLGSETTIDELRPILHQRSYAKLSTRYSKSNVLLRPVEWGSGFHRTRHHNFHIQRDLYLFHFGSVDLEMIKAKMQDKGKIDGGWTKHLKRRAKIIYQISRTKALDWDKTVAVARTIQNLIRPPYAWNKPAMFELVIIVKIAKRFKGII